jgi:NADH-quinone oxidoreductase subunit C
MTDLSQTIVPPMADENAPSLTIRRLLEQFPNAVASWHRRRGDDTVVLKREAIVDACRFLRHEPDLLYDLFIDLTVVDYLPREPRFVVVIHLYSFRYKHRIRLKVPLEESDPVMDTLTSVWRGTNWFEREAWDMYGIVFRGHPNLKRILLYEAFEGHPLRKDYPIDRRQPRIGPKN